jgi:hypothetical protein
MRMVRERAIYLRVRGVTLQASLRRCPTQAAALLTPTTDAALSTNGNVVDELSCRLKLRDSAYLRCG